jgi:hypothetical protein
MLATIVHYNSHDYYGVSMKNTRFRDFTFFVLGLTDGEVDDVEREETYGRDDRRDDGGEDNLDTMEGMDN